jgi:AcrR family transcriptional regulator
MTIRLGLFRLSFSNFCERCAASPTKIGSARRKIPMPHFCHVFLLTYLGRKNYPFSLKTYQLSVNFSYLSRNFGNDLDVKRFLCYLCPMQEQQQRWLLKVQELFFQVGVKSVTMDHIATALGISKKTLYQWVPNKNELVCKVIAMFIQKDQNDCESAFGVSKNALDELRYIKATSSHDLEMMKSNVVFDIKNFYPEAWDLMKAHQRNMVTEVILRNLNRGISEGYYRADLNIDLTARLHGHQIFNLFDEDWFPSKTFAAQTVVSEFMRSYAYNIANEKGRKYLEKYWDLPIEMKPL